MVLAAVGRLSEGRSRRTVFFQPWWYACYGMLDWFLIGGREESAAVMRLSADVSCGWLRCIQERYAARGRYNSSTGATLMAKPVGMSLHAGGGEQWCGLANERLLAEWTVDLGLTLAPLPVRSRGIGVCWAEEWGEVDRAHPAHDVSQLGNCAVGS